MVVHTYFGVLGSDRPALRYLNRYVRGAIAHGTKWHDIGLELLDIGDELILNTIKENHPGDADKCTAEMLQLWLARKPDASWNQLLQALREPNIQENVLAVRIEGMLLKGTIIFYINTKQQLENTVIIIGCICI